MTRRVTYLCISFFLHVEVDFPKLSNKFVDFENAAHYQPLAHISREEKGWEFYPTLTYS